MATKVHVIYDDRGRIRATAVAAHDEMTVRPGFGMQVHTIEHPGVDRAEMAHFLKRLHREHRVDVSGEPRIVRNSSTED